MTVQGAWRLATLLPALLPALLAAAAGHHWAAAAPAPAVIGPVAPANKNIGYFAALIYPDNSAQGWEYDCGGVLIKPNVRWAGACSAGCRRWMQQGRRQQQMPSQRCAHHAHPPRAAGAVRRTLSMGRAAGRVLEQGLGPAGAPWLARPARHKRRRSRGVWCQGERAGQHLQAPRPGRTRRRDTRGLPAPAARRIGCRWQLHRPAARQRAAPAPRAVALQDVIIHPGYRAGDKSTTEMSSDFALLVGFRREGLQSVVDGVGRQAAPQAARVGSSAAAFRRRHHSNSPSGLVHRCRHCCHPQVLDGTSAHTPIALPLAATLARLWTGRKVWTGGYS